MFGAFPRNRGCPKTAVILEVKMLEFNLNKMLFNIPADKHSTPSVRVAEAQTLELLASDLGCPAPCGL